MKQNNLVVTTTNFSSFIASLKSNLSLGYGVCNKCHYLNGYFQASLSLGNDEAYKSRLALITGDEKEDVLSLVEFLGSDFVPFPQELMTRINELVGKAEENKQKEAIVTTIKRAPRKTRAKK